MTTVREDPSLSAPPPPAAVPRLGSAHGRGAVAAVARDAPFLVDGELARVGGRQRGGIEVIRIGGRVVAVGIDVRGTTWGRLVATPGFLRREGTGPSGALLEAVLAAPALPLAAVQWNSPGPPGPLEVSMVLYPGAGAVRYRAAGGTVVAVDEGEPDRVLYVTCCGASGEWELRGGPDGVAATVRVDSSDGATLVFASGNAPTASVAFTAIPHLAAHETLAVSCPPSEGLLVVTGVAELDDAVAWARHRLRTALASTRIGDVGEGTELFWSGLGALAVGDAEGGRRALQRLEVAAADSDSVRTSPHLAAILAGRLALLTGDERPASRHADELRSQDPPSADGTRAGFSLAARTLAVGLRHAYGQDGLAALRALGNTLRVGASLPMAGRPSAVPSSLTEWLASAWAGRPSPPPDDTPPALRLGLDAWNALASDVDRGWTVWRTRLSEGMSDGPAGPGTWDPPGSGLPGRAAGTASLLAGFAHALLGYAPDAPVGRLGLAPRLPRHLRRFGVEGLVVGDASASLAYERHDETHRFTLKPTHGRVPPVVVFEPTVVGTRLGRATIDGAAVELDVRRGRGMLRVAVQLPLDGRRTVELRAE